MFLLKATVKQCYRWIVLRNVSVCGNVLIYVSVSLVPAGHMITVPSCSSSVVKCEAGKRIFLMEHNQEQMLLLVSNSDFSLLFVQRVRKNWMT